MRGNYRSLLIILSFALIWAQNAVSVHDTVHILEHSYSHDHITSDDHDHRHDHDRSHNHNSDDCVMCKIFKKGKDHVHDFTFVSILTINTISKIYDFSERSSFSESSATASSRAPPLLISI